MDESIGLVFSIGALRAGVPGGGLGRRGVRTFSASR